MNDAVMQAINNTLTAATLGMSLMVVLSLIAMVVMYRHFNKIIRHQDETIETLQNDFGALCAGAVGVGNRLDKTEKKVKQLARRQYLYEVQQMKNKNYEQAKNRILRGDDVDKVINDCKITKTEAELILLANRINRVA
ncbi:MAG: DUF2802 domain-containing protein [Gammaproteobacteria bacterium]|jgi:hypothetical protein